jgi:hypothetical protein
MPYPENKGTPISAINPAKGSNEQKKGITTIIPTRENNSREDSLPKKS